MPHEQQTQHHHRQGRGQSTTFISEIVLLRPSTRRAMIRLLFHMGPFLAIPRFAGFRPLQRSLAMFSVTTLPSNRWMIRWA